MKKQWAWCSYRTWIHLSNCDRPRQQTSTSKCTNWTRLESRQVGKLRPDPRTLSSILPACLSDHIYRIWNSLHFHYPLFLVGYPILDLTKGGGGTGEEKKFWNSREGRTCLCLDHLRSDFPGPPERKFFDPRLLSIRGGLLVHHTTHTPLALGNPVPSSPLC